ncbi:Lipase [Diplonema papillatum]|nr:Lipase [Diplonema papillatum]
MNGTSEPEKGGAGRVLHSDPPASPKSDVTDFTSPASFFASSCVWAVRSGENVLSLATEILAIAVLRLASVLVYTVLYPASCVIGVAVGCVRFLCYGSFRWGMLYSAVNFGAIEYLRRYSGIDGAVEKYLAHPPGAGAEGLGDLRVAKYFCMLSCAVYEANWFHDELLSRWLARDGPAGGVRWTRVLNRNSASCTVIRQVINRKIVITVVFKGTSPFNLNEWMSDANLDKVNDRQFLDKYGFPLGGDGSTAPSGRYHEGFFNSLLRSPTRGVPPPLQQILDRIGEYAGPAAGPDDVRLYVTGHSLGAGLASTFASFILAKHPHLTGGAQWDGMKSWLRAVYTYGNPRVADRRIAEVVAANLADSPVTFRRFRNGNDVVGAIPFGTGFMTEMWTRTMYDRPELPQVTSSSFTDWGELGCGFRIRQTGDAISRVPQIPFVTPSGYQAGTWLRFLFVRLWFRVLKYSTGFKESCTNSFLSMYKLSYAALQLAVDVASLAFNLLSPFDKNRDDLFFYFVNTLSAFVDLTQQLLIPSCIYDHTPTQYAQNLDNFARKAGNHAPPAAGPF